LASSESVVILGLGSAAKMDNFKRIRATPGRVGTIPYLAPEMEWDSAYSAGVDVWALAVIGYRLLTPHGRHPWPFLMNPWNRRTGNGKDRDTFHSCCKALCDELGAAGKNTIEDLLHRMLRPDWRPVNGGKRITLAQALKHPGWKEIA
jgi:serine/threonine protein kinase